MIAMLKNNKGVPHFGDYSVAPKNAIEYNTFEEIPNSSYALLSEAQSTRYNEIFNFNKSAELNNSNPENEKIALKNYDLKYIFKGVETPAPEPTFDQKKEKKKQELLGAFVSLQAIQTGYVFEGNTFNFDENTINNVVQQQAEANFSQSADVFQISTRQKQAITFNRVKFFEFGAGYSEIIAPLKRQLSQKQNEIDLAENQTQLDAVNFDFV